MTEKAFNRTAWVLIAALLGGAFLWAAQLLLADQLALRPQLQAHIVDQQRDLGELRGVDAVVCNRLTNIEKKLDSIETKLDRVISPRP